MNQAMADTLVSKFPEPQLLPLVFDHARSLVGPEILQVLGVVRGALDSLEIEQHPNKLEYLDSLTGMLAIHQRGERKPAGHEQGQEKYILLDHSKVLFCEPLHD